MCRSKPGLSRWVRAVRHERRHERAESVPCQHALHDKVRCASLRRALANGCGMEWGHARVCCRPVPESAM